MGVAKSNELYQEFFVRAALNNNPEPLALLQVGIWMKRGELLDFGMTSMLGRSYRELFDRGVRLFPNMQAGELCGKQLVQEYLAENNVEKAQEYAALINLRLAPSSTPTKPKQTVAPARSCKKESRTFAAVFSIFEFSIVSSASVSIECWHGLGRSCQESATSSSECRRKPVFLEKCSVGSSCSCCSCCGCFLDEEEMKDLLLLSFFFFFFFFFKK